MMLPEQEKDFTMPPIGRIDSKPPIRSDDVGQRHAAAFSRAAQAAREIKNSGGALSPTQNHLMHQNGARFGHYNVAGNRIMRKPVGQEQDLPKAGPLTQLRNLFKF
jgi:hypothetical protein